MGFYRKYATKKHTRIVKEQMQKKLLLIIIMATWMVVGCETVRQVKAGCWGHWVEANDGARSGYKRGTILSNRNNVKP